MTRKKAIDRALLALPLSNHGFYREVLENLWTEARIAGLRDAAEIVCHFDGWVPGGSLPAIRSLAKTLAKKARER